MDPRDKGMIARKADRVAEDQRNKAWEARGTINEQIHWAVHDAFHQFAMDLREELNNARQAQRQRAAGQ
jgi:hypothetical protein